MKRSLLFVMMLSGWMIIQAGALDTGPLPSGGPFVVSADTRRPRASTTRQKIGASAVWQPPKDFLAKAHAVCDKAMNPASYGECFINQMSAAGAPADGRELYPHALSAERWASWHHEAFKKFGPVDAAQVFYPLRANDNYGLLLVNGDPNILDVDDLKKLDQSAMQQDPMFQAIKKQFPAGGPMAGRPQQQRSLAAVATFARWRSALRRELSADQWMPCLPAFRSGAVWLEFRCHREIPANHLHTDSTTSEATEAAARATNTTPVTAAQQQPQAQQNPQ